MNNRKIDELIAECVMGYTNNKDSKVYLKPMWAHDCMGTFKKQLFPNYSTDIKYAWEVWEKLRQSGKWCCLKISSDYSFVYDIILTESELSGNNPDHKPTIVITTENICKGICLAALKAYGISYD